MGEEIAVLVGAADERVLLGERCVRPWRSRASDLQGRQGFGHRLLGQRLDVAVAVHALLQRGGTGGINEVVGVTFGQVDDAQSLRWPTRPSMANSISHNRAAWGPMARAWPRMKRVSREGLRGFSTFVSPRFPRELQLAELQELQGRRPLCSPKVVARPR